MDLYICLWEESGLGTCWTFPKECASRVCCIILLCKREGCHINYFQSLHDTFEYLQTFYKQNGGRGFFPLFPLLHVILDLQKSYKLGLTGWLDRFIAALYPCNGRYQAKHSQIRAWGSKHYSRYRANLLNVARITCLLKAADSWKQPCGKVYIISFISMQY